ncbi:MAG: CotH kinase family protein [Paludibacteraceae bacterium]
MKRLSFFFAAILCYRLSIAASTYSGTLPVLFIETTNHETVTSKEYYLQGTYYLDPMGIAGVEAIGSPTAPLPLQIKGRGNYTWTGFDKKPYRLKLDGKATLLGLKANKHFALLAHADDNKGFMRNTVGLWLSEQLGLAWTPKQRPVELVLNGDYKGLYFLTETIRVDKNRVNITEQADGLTDPDLVTGGWLIEIDNYDTDPHVEIQEGDGSRLIATNKSPEVLSAEQTAFLTDELTRINQLVYGDKQSDKLWDYVDIDALARFYIVQEITDNYESFHGSCYLHRDLGTASKWVFGPVWDFGSAFNYDKTQYIYQGREWHNTWIEQICQFPRFMQTVQTIWQSFCGNGYSGIYPYITAFANEIGEAAKADAQRWQQKGYGNADIPERLTFITERLQDTEQWLRAQWGEPTAIQQNTIDKEDNPQPQYFTLQGTPLYAPLQGQPYIVRQGNSAQIQYIP